MDWIITAALAVGVLVLVVAVAFVLRTKRHDAGSVPGRFDFDGYKEGELSRRGLFDKTKWRWGVGRLAWPCKALSILPGVVLSTSMRLE